MDATKQILMISADCHAGPEQVVYRQYLENSVHEEYDAWVAEAEVARVRKRSLFEDKFLDKHNKGTGGEQGGAVTGAWDPEQRIRQLEDDGTVAEVIYPDSIVAGGVPFGAGISMNSSKVDPRLTLAGARAPVTAPPCSSNNSVAAARMRSRSWRLLRSVRFSLFIANRVSFAHTCT